MRADEIMTAEVATVRADAPITEAIALMEERGVSGLPVLDEYGRLAGMLTEGDLLRRAEMGTAGRGRPGWLDLLLGSGGSASDYVRSHGRRVEDLMTRDAVTVGPGTPVEEVVALMEQRRVKRVPVVQDGEVIGIVSRADLVRALGRALQASAMGSSADAAIRERLLAELRGQSWFPARDVSVAVRGGVVAFEGTISDERARAALRVAAQTVPGVAAVEDKLVWVDPAAAGLVF